MSWGPLCMLHSYIDTAHYYIITAYSWTTATRMRYYTATWLGYTQLLHVLIPLDPAAYMHCLSMYSYLHWSWFILVLHGYAWIPVIWNTVSVTCIFVSCYWYGFPVTGHESCWYATCGIPHLLFPFPVILFYAINRAQVRLSCYPYHVLYLFLLHCILDISDHKANLGMGETWRLIRSYRVMYWIHIVLPLQGTVVLPTNCSMSSHYLIIVPLLAEGPGLSSQGFV